MFINIETIKPDLLFGLSREIGIDDNNYDRKAIYLFYHWEGIQLYICSNAKNTEINIFLESFGIYLSKKKQTKKQSFHYYQKLKSTFPKKVGIGILKHNDARSDFIDIYNPYNIKQFVFRFSSARTTQSTNLKRIQQLTKHKIKKEPFSFFLMQLNKLRVEELFSYKLMVSNN